MRCHLKGSAQAKNKTMACALGSILLQGCEKQGKSSEEFDFWSGCLSGLCSSLNLGLMFIRALSSTRFSLSLCESNRKAMNRNWSN